MAGMVIPILLGPAVAEVGHQGLVPVARLVILTLEMVCSGLLMVIIMLVAVGAVQKEPLIMVQEAPEEVVTDLAQRHIQTVYQLELVQ